MHASTVKHTFRSLLSGVFAISGGLALATGLLLGATACDLDDAEQARDIAAADLEVEALHVDPELGEELALDLDLDEGSPVDGALLDELRLCDPGAAPGEGCEDATEKDKATTCYCGYGPGGAVYVTANCAGYPGTHVCCAAACSTGAGEDGSN